MISCVFSYLKMNTNTNIPILDITKSSVYPRFLLQITINEATKIMKNIDILIITDLISKASSVDLVVKLKPLRLIMSHVILKIQEILPLCLNLFETLIKKKHEAEDLILKIVQAKKDKSIQLKKLETESINMAKIIKSEILILKNKNYSIIYIICLD